MSAAYELGVPISKGSLSSLAQKRPAIWNFADEAAATANNDFKTKVGVFAALWVLIGGVSAYDTYLTVRYQETLVLLERNPVAIWLLSYDDWNPATLVGLKFLGSMIVLGALSLSFWWRPRWGLLMSLSIALFQTALLVFLTIV